MFEIEKSLMSQVNLFVISNGTYPLNVYLGSYMSKKSRRCYCKFMVVFVNAIKIDFLSPFLFDMECLLFVQGLGLSMCGCVSVRLSATVFISLIYLL